MLPFTLHFCSLQHEEAKNAIYLCFVCKHQPFHCEDNSCALTNHSGFQQRMCLEYSSPVKKAEFVPYPHMDNYK